ncbi:MAG: nucleotidyltransferase substrate binding protein [Bacteroidales bacterium]|nr:nucleotidyltransferase substrate binding protein [Bacteroidales bacterium]
MTSNLQILAKQNKEKVKSSVMLVEASLSRVKQFDPSTNYSAIELEPFDALCDRFVRAVEVSIQFFKTYEKLKEAIISDNFRDLLLKMEKWKLISEMPVWFEMRDVRNRVVHDYLPEQRKNMYDDIINRFSNELIHTKGKIEKLL